ncbi:MAG: membrane protein insertion efficiency factor YidD [Treponema sp.]|jgi:putative membrane protein insertion efficiency factor|nr:membrane protein insertion efficiency factor YidD [Treponema sp.]
MKNIALILIKFYQYAVSPHFPPVCRYYPSCSSYAYEAVQKHGFLRGGALAVKRIFRCHPFHHGGYDPVPEFFNNPLTKEIQWKKIQF